MDKNQQAWQRGVRMASLWKKLKASVLHFDNRCVTWVKRKNLPAWLGHFPIFLFGFIALCGCIVWGLLAVFSLVTIWALMVIISNIGSHNCPDHSHHDRESDGMFTPYDPKPYSYDEYDNKL
ncbi:hypothetical protein MLE32_000548 [Klebsiella aerogenes]|nr:hypothetical protein [Klebsiella aerogenes]